MTELEYKLLKKKAKSILTNGEEYDSSDEKDLGDHNLPVQAVTKSQNIKGTEMKDKVQFKRKKAKVMNHFHLFCCSVFSINFGFILC